MPNPTDSSPLTSSPDLAIDFCGIRCANPFILASSPVAHNYEMCVRALEAGWVLPKAERDKTIVDMYINGHSFDDIWAASGFSSKSSIWRILNKYGVKLDRGQTSGPRVKQKPEEDGTNEGDS